MRASTTRWLVPAAMVLTVVGVGTSAVWSSGDRAVKLVVLAVALTVLVGSLVEAVRRGDG